MSFQLLTCQWMCDIFSLWRSFLFDTRKPVGAPETSTASALNNTFPSEAPEKKSQSFMFIPGKVWLRALAVQVSGGASGGGLYPARPRASTCRHNHYGFPCLFKCRLRGFVQVEVSLMQIVRL